jgi:hypothetical protein
VRVGAGRPLDLHFGRNVSQQCGASDFALGIQCDLVVVEGQIPVPVEDAGKPKLMRIVFAVSEVDGVEVDGLAKRAVGQRIRLFTAATAASEDCC